MLVISSPVVSGTVAFGESAILNEPVAIGETVSKSTPLLASVSSSFRVTRASPPIKNDLTTASPPAKAIMVGLFWASPSPIT